MTGEAHQYTTLSRTRRTALYLTAWLAFLVAFVGLAARFVPVANHAVLIVAALSPYLMVLAALSAFLLLLARQWWTASAALMLTAVAVFVELPLFIGSNGAPPNTIPIRVLTANLYEGAAAPKDLAAIACGRADLVVFEELTPEIANSLVRYGLDSTFPYTALNAQPAASGAGIWSRYPVVRSRMIAGYPLSAISAVIRPPDATSDVVVLGIHIVGPWPQPIDGWRDEFATLPGTVGEVAASASKGAAIVAGDFNATFDMAPLRRLVRDDYRDAAEQSGAGLTRSYPADSVVPPFVGIDRILTHNASAADAQTVRIPGSDHLGLVATVHVPK